MEQGDEAFVALFLAAEVERPVALAGVGRLDEANQALDRLFNLYGESQNPLTRGRLSEAGVRVALLAGDGDSFAHHLAETRSWFHATGTPALIARAEALAAYARRSSMPPPEGSLRPLSTIGTSNTATGVVSESAEAVTSARRVRRPRTTSMQPSTAIPDTDDIATAVLPDDTAKS